MSNIERTQPEAGMRESLVVTQFAAWIERVTVPTTSTDYEPRHRAGGDAS